MPDLREVSREDAEKIWTGQCPKCGGRLLAGPRGGVSANVMCENGCQKYNVPPIPALPRRICYERH